MRDVRRTLRGLLAGLGLGAVLVMTGCRSTPAPTPAPIPGNTHRPAPGPVAARPVVRPAAPAPAPRPAPAAVVEAVVRAPVVMISVPETTRNPSLDEFPVIVMARAKHTGDAAPAGDALGADVEHRLIGGGARLAPAPAGRRPGIRDGVFLVSLVVATKVEMDLGAGRALVSGTADLRVSRIEGDETVRRERYEMDGGADRTEADAVREVLAGLGKRAGNEALAAVRDYARLTREEVIGVVTADPDLSLTEMCAPLLESLGKVEGLWGVTMQVTEPGGDGQQAWIYVRIAPDFNGRLPEIVTGIVRREGVRPQVRYEMDGR